MLSHLGVGVAYDALDGLNIHAQRLHLRYIGVAAAVRCEQADIARFFQRFAEWWNGTIVLASGRSGLRQQTGFF